MPYATTPDRARTGAVVIPDGKRPNLGLAKRAEICSSAIVLKDPRDLPWATLAPALRACGDARGAAVPGFAGYAGVALLTHAVQFPVPRATVA